MNDCDKRKSQLIAELSTLRQRLALDDEPNRADRPATTATQSDRLQSERLQSVGIEVEQVDGRSELSPRLNYTELAAALRKSEERLAEVQRVATLGYYSFDIVNNAFTSSQPLLDILGIRKGHPNDLSGWLMLIPPEQRATMEAYLTNLLINRQNFDKEYQIVHGKTRESRWVHGLGQLRLDDEGRPVELFGTIQDITARKKAEEALRSSEETYRNLINGMKEAVWVTDFNHKFIDCNETAGEMLQYSREELLTMGPPDIDLSLSTEELLRLDQGSMKDRIRIFETTHTRKDGKTIPVEIQSTLVTYHGEAVVLAIARDITTRKRAEAALQKSEAMNRLLATVVRQASEAIVITNLAGTIDYVNPAYEAMTGYPAHELLGQELMILKQRNRIGKTKDTLWETVQQSEPWTGRYQDQRKDGTHYHKDVTIFPIYDGDGQITKYCQIARDVSHELQLRQQLNQAQRLETIGTLAGGIAHDFNNILMPIIGYAEMAGARLSSTDPLQINLQQILNGAHRARELVRQILTFSRQHEQQRNSLYLHLVVEEALKLMRPSIPSTIEIRQQIDSTCEKVLADATQLHQVVVNLCTNAFHAMEANGGILTITLEQVTVDHTLVQLYPTLQQSPYVRLTVSDTGIGMDSATLERIFEPFFTTKPVDRGTGLGLSVAHGIIHSHEGILIAQSELGKGRVSRSIYPSSSMRQSRKLTNLLRLRRATR